MNKYSVFINDVQYEFEEKISILEACKSIGITLPTIYLNDDIDYVFANSNIVSSSLLIEDMMNIYTSSIELDMYIENIVKELHAKLKTSCSTCSVVNCPLKEQFNKYHLTDNGASYKDCTYYQNGVFSKVLKEVEKHDGLEQMLSDRNIHKVAIIEQNMKPKTADILNKGFNEVITSDFVKKFKIIEESALFLKEMAKSLDKRENLLPVYILEDSSYKRYVQKENHKNIINVGSLVDLATKIFKATLEYEKIAFVFITENRFNNETNKEVTYEYLMSLPNVESPKINNITNKLKLDNKEVNYNSFVNYLIEILKSKQTFNLDIYNISDYEIKLRGKTIKISNLRHSDCASSDIILVLDDVVCTNTPSVLNDNDVNYVYKNFIKKPGEL